MMSPPMAGCRLGAAVTSRVVRRKFVPRTFTSSSRQWAAQNFVMPALSPTMTEGNIAKWNIKEGDSFSAGDVLLDIETDKAQMDVEAQDDGVLAKIMQQDGTKGVKVGTRIAVTAEQGDDLSSLEIPADESKGQEAPREPTPNTAKEQQTSPTQEAPKSQPSDRHVATPKQPPQKYPLYPSVQAVLEENGLGVEDVNKIPASGPNGRLLKGDVLGYVGKIQKEYSAEQSSRITKQGHLDLSNIQRAAPKPQPKPAPRPKPEAASRPEPDLEVALPISLDAVLATQSRIKESLGLTLPLSTFIARASEIANEALPRARGPPTVDELYDAVLGLDKVKKTSRGSYSPNVTALARGPSSVESPPKSKAKGSDDVIDILTGKSTQRKITRAPSMLAASGVASANSTNVFSVSAKKGDEQRARTYLERMKSVLEAEPGRCVL